MAARRARSSLQQCPLCLCYFPPTSIQQHASSCDGVAREQQAPAPARGGGGSGSSAFTQRSATVAAPTSRQQAPGNKRRESKRSSSGNGRRSPLEAYFSSVAPPKLGAAAPAPSATAPSATAPSRKRHSSGAEAEASARDTNGRSTANGRQRTPSPPSGAASRSAGTAAAAPAAVSASGAAAAATAAAAPLATRWGALVDAERRRLLEDPQASVRRTVRQWLQCQRADAGAYTKCYSNPFSDYRPPGSASDNLRDPLHLAVRRVAAADAGGPSGGRRRSGVEQAVVQRSNLLLICREVLTGPARGALPPATAETAAVVVRAAPEVQQLIAQVRQRSRCFAVSS
eukprot:COSAG06_NODE_1069_length_10828_cov_22.835493_4_plen_343_part_00